MGCRIASCGTGFRWRSCYHERRLVAAEIVARLKYIQTATPLCWRPWRRRRTSERRRLIRVPLKRQTMARSVQRSKVLGISPVLVVYPLMRAVDFYWKKLGFDHPRLFGDPPTFAVLERDGFALCLQEADFD